MTKIEKLTFADKNALITSKEIKPIDALGFQAEKVYSGKSDSYKFYDLGSDSYGVGTSAGIDELTGESMLKFDDKKMNLKNDIKATFDQVTGLDTDSGKCFDYTTPHSNVYLTQMDYDIESVMLVLVKMMKEQLPHYFSLRRI